MLDLNKMMNKNEMNTIHVIVNHISNLNYGNKSTTKN